MDVEGVADGFSLDVGDEELELSLLQVSRIRVTAPICSSFCGGVSLDYTMEVKTSGVGG